MSKKLISPIIWGILLIILAVVLALAIVKFDVLNISTPKTEYVAVYLNTGDIYFGKLLSKHDEFKLSEVVLLQKDNKGNLTAPKFKDSFWQPEEPMYINKDNVVFWTRLAQTSPMIKAIEGTQTAAEQPAAE